MFHLSRFILAICLMAVISSCTTQDAFTGEEKTSNTAKGAGIGALSGAILGAPQNTRPHTRSTPRQADRTASLLREP